MSNIDCFEELTFAAVTAAFILLSESLANTLPSQGSGLHLAKNRVAMPPSAKPDKGSDIDKRRAVIGFPHGGGREAKR